MKERKGIKFPLAEVDDDKVIVSMIEFQGLVLIATQKGVYKMVDDKFVRLKFVEKE